MDSLIFINTECKTYKCPKCMVGMESRSAILYYCKKYYQTYNCIDCNEEFIARYEKLPLRCRPCWLKYHRRYSPLQCIDCGKPLNPKSPRITKRCYACFIKSHSTVFKEPTYGDFFGHWLAGFVDGEGNFQHTDHHGGCFRINLREDDKPVLDEIRSNLGCGVMHYLKKKSSNNNTRNQWQFTVATLVDLVNVVIPFFDKYPLRAKKKYDYLRWREDITRRWKEAMGG